MDGAVDRLASVSRVMFDQRIIDMNKEIHDLKSELAWEHFGPRELNHLLGEKNTTGLEIICTCEACLISKRFCECDLEILNETFRLKEDEQPRDCIVKQCLKFHCDQLGLICIEEDEDESASDDEEDGDALYNTKKECHIFIANHAGNTFWKAGYGKMLDPENFHENPDLVKIQLLLTLIDETVDFFKMDETDFFAMADDRE
jgi:hypothetical protein